MTDRPLHRSFLLADGRGGCTHLSLAGFPVSPWHAAYVPDASAGTRVAWMSPGLGLELAGREVWLPESAEAFQHGSGEATFEEFQEDPLPRWVYRVAEARLEVQLAPQQGSSAMVLRVQIHGARAGTRLLFRPAFAPRWTDRTAATSALLYASETPHSRAVHCRGDGASLEVLHAEAQTISGPRWEPVRRAGVHWFRSATLALAIPRGESVRDFRVAVSGTEFQESGRAFEDELARLQALPAAGLARSLDRYRVSSPTGRMRLVAGMPASQERGLRPVLRALPRLFSGADAGRAAREQLAELSAEAFEAPRETAFAAGDSGDSGEPPILGQLEWLVAADRLLDASPSVKFLKGEVWPRGRELFEQVRRGVAGAPRLRNDGLLEFAPAPAGASSTELPEMELNLLWFGSLETLGAACGPAGRGELQDEFARLAQAAGDRLRARFAAALRGESPWTAAETLFALDLPEPPLDAEAAAGFLVKVRRDLFEPDGIRLAGEGSEPRWLHEVRVPALLGPWLRAERRFGSDPERTDESLRAIRQLEPTLLREGVLGHVPPLRVSADRPDALEALDPFEPGHADLETDAEFFALAAQAEGQPAGIRAASPGE